MGEIMHFISSFSYLGQIACYTACLGLGVAVSGPATAAIIGADAIAKQLVPEDDGPISRSILSRKAITFHVAPDAQTRACDKPTSSGTGVASRNLYVENAPSIDLDIAFAFDRSELLPAGAAQLDQLAAALTGAALAQKRVAIAGHTDAVGSTGYNDKLSCDRALVVRNYLRDRHKIDPTRIAVFGFGSTRLKDTERPTSDVNRRTEVRLIPADQ